MLFDRFALLEIGGQGAATATFACKWSQTTPVLRSRENKLNASVLTRAGWCITIKVCYLLLLLLYALLMFETTYLHRYVSTYVYVIEHDFYYKNVVYIVHKFKYLIERIQPQSLSFWPDPGPYSQVLVLCLERETTWDTGQADRCLFLSNVQQSIFVFLVGANFQESQLSLNDPCFYFSIFVSMSLGLWRLVCGPGPVPGLLALVLDRQINGYAQRRSWRTQTQFPKCKKRKGWK